MDRRSYLASAATGLVALAGCSQGSNSGPSNTTTTTSQTSMTTTTSGPPLSVSASMPSAVEIASTATLTVAVTNNTSSEQTYTSEVSQRIQNGEWTTLEDVTVEITVPAGQKVTREFDVPGYEFLSAGSYRLDNGEHVARTLFTTRTLEMGQAYVSPAGAEITVEKVTFPEQYTYSSPEGPQTRDPPTDGERWAVTHLTVKNVTDSEIQSPTTEAIVLRLDSQNEFGDQVFEPTNLDQYSSVTLQPGESVSGEIASDVDTSIAATDLYVGYDKQFEAGRAKVHWPVPAQS